MAKSEAKNDVSNMSFEEALDELRGIVEGLEKGEGKLEAAIESYERGAALKRHCEAKLREAQEKIERIVQGPDGQPASAPFNVD